MINLPHRSSCFCFNWLIGCFLIYFWSEWNIFYWQKAKGLGTISKISIVFIFIGIMNKTNAIQMSCKYQKIAIVALISYNIPHFKIHFANGHWRYESCSSWNLQHSCKNACTVFIKLSRHLIHTITCIYIYRISLLKKKYLNVFSYLVITSSMWYWKKIYSVPQFLNFCMHAFIFCVCLVNY